MSRSSNNPTGRWLAVAGILALAALTLPSSGHAQSPAGERALLNRMPGGAVAARALRLAARYPESYQRVDGQRALTARVGYAAVATVEAQPLVAEAFARGEVTGARALMGASFREHGGR